MDPGADKIPASTKAVVATRSAVGEQYVLLQPDNNKGPYLKDGMPDFTDRLKPQDIEKLKAFIQGTADAIRPKK